MNKIYYFLSMLYLFFGFNSCSIFEPEEFQPFVTFEKTFGVGGIYNAFDVIELESNYLIIGSGGSQCNIVDASSLLLDKVTGQQINFNSFGRVGFGSQDYFLDMERLSDNDFIAIGRSLKINEQCESQNPLNPDAELFLASFDAELNSNREPLFFNADSTDLTSSKWDAGFNVSVEQDNLYIAGAWAAYNSIFITDINNSKQNTWYRVKLVGQYFDLDIKKDEVIILTGEVHNFSSYSGFANFKASLNYKLDYDGWSLVFTKVENCEEGNCHILQERFYALPDMMTLVGRSINETDDGGFIIVGNATDFSKTQHIFLLRIDQNGNEITHRVLPGEGLARDITKVEDGYVLTGHLDGDLVIIKIDDRLNDLWTSPIKYNNAGNSNRKQEGFTIINTTDGGLLVVGSSELGEYNNTMYIVKTDAEGKVQ